MMEPEAKDLGWSVTTRVMKDPVLTKTLRESQSSGEKHAVISLNGIVERQAAGATRGHERLSAVCA